MAYSDTVKQILGQAPYEKLLLWCDQDILSKKILLEISMLLDPDKRLYGEIKRDSSQGGRRLGKNLLSKWYQFRPQEVSLKKVIDVLQNPDVSLNALAHELSNLPASKVAIVKPTSYKDLDGQILMGELKELFVTGLLDHPDASFDYSLSVSLGVEREYRNWRDEPLNMLKSKEEKVGHLFDLWVQHWGVQATPEKMENTLRLKNANLLADGIKKLIEENPPQSSQSVALGASTKKKTSSKQEKIIEFDMELEVVPSSQCDINLFENENNQEPKSSPTEYQLKLKAQHRFGDDSNIGNKKARFVLIIDRSGSMSGEPWKQVQKALIEILDLTKNTETTCTAIAYNQGVTNIEITGDIDTDTKTIMKLRPHGATNFVAVFEELENTFRNIDKVEDSTCNYHIFFLTDGNDTINVAREIMRGKENLETEVHNSGADVLFHVIGFSTEHDAAFLEKLRLMGTQDGTYSYVSPSDGTEALKDRLVTLIESTAGSIGRTIHLELVSEDVEFQKDWFGASTNETILPAMLKHEDDVTVIRTRAFVNVKKEGKLDVALNVFENLRGSTKPIEGIIKSQNFIVLEKEDAVTAFQLRKIRLAVNMVTDRVSEIDPDDTIKVEELKKWYHLIKTRVANIREYSKTPDLTRIMGTIQKGLKLCSSILESDASFIQDEMKMKMKAVQSTFQMETGTEHNMRVNLRLPKSSSHRVTEIPTHRGTKGNEERMSVGYIDKQILKGPIRRKAITERMSTIERVKSMFIRGSDAEQNEKSIAHEEVTCYSLASEDDDTSSEDDTLIIPPKQSSYSTFSRTSDPED